jgi:hypothetical protein
MSNPLRYGCMAEFASAEALLAAVAHLRAAGYTRLEAYAPYPVEGLAEALGPVRDRVALLTLLGGLFGGFGTLALQYYAAVVDYPINVGGRPDASWPAFIPAALEMTFLFAALAGVIGMLAGNGLPQLYHPVFHVERFTAASRDGFFVLLRADDPRWAGDTPPRAFDTLGALAIEEVPA